MLAGGWLVCSVLATSRSGDVFDSSEEVEVYEEEEEMEMEEKEKRGDGDEDGDEENGNESDGVDWLTKFPPQCNRHMKKLMMILYIEEYDDDVNGY